MTKSVALKAVIRNEMARHCRRRTRGVDVTLQLIEELLLTFSTAIDSYGVPLFGEQMITIWEEEKKHIPCIQDPPCITSLGTSTRGSSTTSVQVCSMYNIS